ncbi:MAG: peptidylprolyl isomerase [Pseudomonas fluorescens]|nr:MAG: peptidylprolyl isomerase [Pseudomonas fluorescens]
MTLVLRKSLLAVVASSALLLTACGDKQDDTGKTLATVNGVAVKESRVDDQLAQIPAAMMQGREAEVKRQILDRVIDQELITQEAKRLKVTSEADYKKQLALVENQLQANFVIAKKVSDTLTTDTLKAAYEANKANNAFPAVRARHILVPTEAEANAVLASVTPANFAETAKKFSKGPSANEGGELGWFRREAMIPEFAAVAFSTPAGTVAKTPVKTQFGWHVILVEERNDRYTPPFEQMEPQLRQEMAQQVVQGYLTDLRKGATITYEDGAAPAAPAEGATPAAPAAPAAQ